jgi:hypothetical protein
MAAPLQRLAAALRKEDPRRTVEAVLIHESPRDGIRTAAVAQGVRAADWREWLSAPT